MTNSKLSPFVAESLMTTVEVIKAELADTERTGDLAKLPSKTLLSAVWHLEDLFKDNQAMERELQHRRRALLLLEAANRTLIQQRDRLAVGYDSALRLWFDKADTKARNEMLNGDNSYGDLVTRLETNRGHTDDS